MTTEYHKTRLVFDSRRDILWKSLCKYYFDKKISSSATVLDLGCGYCEFINNISANDLYALDKWEGFTEYLREEATAIVSPVTDLTEVPDKTIDFAFASNLFEHLTQDEIASTLLQLKSKLAAGGVLSLLQPNYRFCSTQYFDDYTHVSIWSHTSLPDFLRANGYEIIELHPKFMPLTIKSRLPVTPSLIGLYLSLPFSPMGKQMLISARPVRDST